MSSTQPSPQPVAGEVVGKSIVKTAGSMLFVLLIFLFGLFLIWAWWTGATLERLTGPRQVSFVGLLIGIGVVLFAPLMFASLLHGLIRRERLVLAGDRCSWFTNSRERIRSSCRSLTTTLPARTTR